MTAQVLENKKNISNGAIVSNKNSPRKITHRVVIVPTSYVNVLWSEVQDQLKRAVKRSNGRWTMEVLYEAMTTGKQQLWIALNKDNDVDGVATTEIIKYPNKKMLAIQFIGGNYMNDWAWDILEKFEEFAIEAECEGIEATARKGFWKWLSQDDFEQSYVVYEKRIIK